MLNPMTYFLSILKAIRNIFKRKCIIKAESPNVNQVVDVPAEEEKKEEIADPNVQNT